MLRIKGKGAEAGTLAPLGAYERPAFLLSHLSFSRNASFLGKDVPPAAPQVFLPVKGFSPFIESFDVKTMEFGC
jgi:hypothetical protein